MDSIKEQINSRRLDWEALRSAGKVLCKCSRCEQDIPLHERQNYINRRTASRHKRGPGPRGPQAGEASFYSVQEIVTSLTQALGLEYAHELLEEAVAGQRSQSDTAGASEHLAPQENVDPEAAEGFANMLGGMRFETFASSFNVLHAVFLCSCCSSCGSNAAYCLQAWQLM